MYSNPSEIENMTPYGNCMVFINELLDDDHPLAPTSWSPSPLVMTVKLYVPFFLPCRPNHPDTVATLWKANTMVNVSSVMSYNPRRGFHVSYPTIYHSGLFTCRAVVNGTSSSLDFVLVFMG